MKRRIVSLLVVMVLGIVLTRVVWIGVNRISRSSGDRDAPPSIDSIRRLAVLESLEVKMSDVVTARLDGQFGGISVVLVAQGSAIFGIDLSDASVEQVDTQQKTAVLRLKSPSVRSVRLDPEATRIVEMTESGLWFITPTNRRADAAVIAKAYRAAEAQLRSHADNPALIDLARRQAEQTIQTLYKPTGWSVVPTWDD